MPRGRRVGRANEHGWLFWAVEMMPFIAGFQRSTHDEGKGRLTSNRLG